MGEPIIYGVKDFQAVCNQVLENAFSYVIIEGEVSSFKLNQGKYVFFDLKEDDMSLGCFMMAYQLRFPLEDGMKVRVRALPKLTKWGKFSLTVSAVRPMGEGSLKKSFELLKKKLTAEGLFDVAKKRPLPSLDTLSRIAVISSTQAAGYADFCKILNERWGGMKVQVAHTQVQGMAAADQIIKALKYFNERGENQVIAIIRGGGSADDLSCFNDEGLVRAVAASKIPVITGIGHEVDTSLCDLAADVVASTPSNAAQMLSRDKRALRMELWREMLRTRGTFNLRVDNILRENRSEMQRVGRGLVVKITTSIDKISEMMKRIAEMDPEKVLRRGYALLSGDVKVGSVVKITTENEAIEAKVEKVMTREK